MKNFTFIIGLFISLLSVTPLTINAAIEVHTSITHVAQKPTEASTFKKQSKYKKADVDLKHPVKKWLWLSLIFLLASVVFRAFKFGSFAYILGAVAFICLIVWFLKLVDVL